MRRAICCAAAYAHCFLQEQRVEYSSEFVRSLQADAHKHRSFGVLLSGPNGVGKSAIGLLAFLASFAQRLPAVYISAARAWVEAAHDGRGDDFFLDTLWRQNADLIAASDELRPVFAASLRDEAVGEGTMQRLRDVLRSRPGPSIGVIVDEAQRITEAVAAGKVPNPPPSVLLASSYFDAKWHDWENATSALFACPSRARMASASTRCRLARRGAYASCTRGR